MKTVLTLLPPLCLDEIGGGGEEERVIICCRYHSTLLHARGANSGMLLAAWDLLIPSL